MDKVKKILIISSDKNLKDVLNFCFDGWGYEVFLWEAPVHDITPIKKISPNVIVADVYSAHRNQLHICQLLKDDFTTSFIPVITLINKRQLRSHLLNLKQGVDDYLIKPPDPLDLRIRVEMAIKRSQYSFYATPLTGLPGARLIEEIVGEKVKKNTPFSFGYVDIDRFKYFNDVYGYLKGDRVIMQSAYILYRVIKKFGNPDDFIGHIGGDDFVFITTPDKKEQICQQFILMFDKIIPFHYSLQDRKQGFIVARDRTHKLKKLALMSVSIAVVSRKDSADFKNFIEINERIVEIKQYLKNIEGSKFMDDRRNGVKSKGAGPHVYKKEELNSYRPIGQLLVERKIISFQQLEDVLKIHWKRGIMLGEILKELGFVKQEQLTEVLNVQKEYLADKRMFV
ncbi:MAG: diguanylate cyclase [Candidatus Omnitrophota bacterium]|nr:MAG: diguanylate cyclase [Candidatus Omnitrophota bacterium]